MKGCMRVNKCPDCGRIDDPCGAVHFGKSGRHRNLPCYDCAIVLRETDAKDYGRPPDDGQPPRPRPSRKRQA